MCSIYGWEENYCMSKADAHNLLNKDIPQDHPVPACNLQTEQELGRVWRMCMEGKSELSSQVTCENYSY